MAIAILDDPIEDGCIELEAGPTYTRNSTGPSISFGGWGNGEIWLKDYRGYVEWDISGLAGGTLTANPIFKYHGDSIFADEEEINPLTEEAPSGAADIDLYGYIASGPAYVDPWAHAKGTNKEVDLGATARAHLQAAMDAGQSWFAIGLQSPAPDEGHYASTYASIYSKEYSTPTPPPTLYVEYTPLPKGGSRGYIIG
ncbi:hypothetical protein ES705_24009 [subsurface metagenome]